MDDEDKETNEAFDAMIPGRCAEGRRCPAQLPTATRVRAHQPPYIVRVTLSVDGNLSFNQTRSNKDVESNEPFEVTIPDQSGDRRLHPSPATTLTRAPAQQSSPLLTPIAAAEVLLSLNQSRYSEEVTDEPNDATIPVRCGTRRVQPILPQTATQASALQPSSIITTTVEATSQQSFNQGMDDEAEESDEPIVKKIIRASSSRSGCTLACQKRPTVIHRVIVHRHDDTCGALASRQSAPAQPVSFATRLDATKPPEPPVSVRPSGHFFTQRVMSCQADAAEFAEAAAVQQQYQQQIKQQSHQQQPQSSPLQTGSQIPPQPLPPPPLTLSAKPMQSSQPVIITPAQKPRPKTSPVYESKPQSPEEMNEIVQLAKTFKQRRCKLGLSQRKVSLAMRNMYTDGPSKATLSRFEACTLNFECCTLNFETMCRLIPYVQRWLEDTDASNSNPQLLQTKGRTTPELIWKWKTRNKIKRSDRLALEEAFQRKSKPTSEEIEILAKSNGLEKKVVMSWFHNRRCRESRNPSSASI